MVYPLINNYKAQRNVRAELSGAVDLGEPVSLYIKEDEIKITGNNLINDNAYKDSAVTGDGGWSKYGDNVITTTETSLRIASDGSGHENGAYIYFRNGTKSFVDNDLVVGRQYVLSCFMLTDSTTAHLEIRGGSNTADGTTGTGQKELRFTAGSADGHYLRTDDLDTGSAKFVELSNIKLFEVTDHTYKLMALNDTIPSGGINVEAEGSEMISTQANREFNSGGQWAQYNSPTSADIVSEKFQVVTTGSGTEGATLPVANLTAPVAGRTYRIRAKLDNVDGANLDATYKFSFGGTSETITASDGTPNNGMITTSEEEYYADVVAANTDGNLVILIPNAANDEATTFTIDDVSVKEVLGYDYYNAPAYKFGIVSSVYDQSTGAMKTSGAAGDEVEVTVQGECNIVRSGGSNVSVVKDYVITKIDTSGNPTDYNPASLGDSGAHQNVPNSVGVITETNSSSETAKAILWQGVEFSEHFVHKNSLQVHAKCAETITKFRPVSLYLDSEGDLLCRHDDIPAERPDADTDHTGVDPSKWGVAELGGVSGDIIPVTVAGKTHMNTSTSVVEGRLIQQLKESGSAYQQTISNGILPNALGTYLADGPGDVPITIFNGTPIGTITNWKRTIKVTAKANGAITQYCPVSLYLDQYGNYKCTSDGIPNLATDTDNGTWVDFRKWGIAQTTVADGENVEIIVQGRTNVVDAKASADRGEFVRKITSAGVVSSNDSESHALSCIGIVEKEAKTSDGTPGTIIIF